MALVEVLSVQEKPEVRENPYRKSEARRAGTQQGRGAVQCRIPRGAAVCMGSRGCRSAASAAPHVLSQGMPPFQDLT